MSSFKVKKTDPLFSTPLCLFEIENNADLNKNLFLNPTLGASKKKARTCLIKVIAGIHLMG